MHIRKSYNDGGNIFLITALFYEVLERKTEHHYPFWYSEQSTASSHQRSCGANGVLFLTSTQRELFSR
jgi:hypothetical protein